MRSPRPRRKRCFRLFVLRSCRAQSRHLGLSPRSICEAPPEIPRQARDDSPSIPPVRPSKPSPPRVESRLKPQKRQNGRFSPFLIDFQPVFRIFRDFRSFPAVFGPPGPLRRLFSIKSAPKRLARPFSGPKRIARDPFSKTALRSALKPAQSRLHARFQPVRPPPIPRIRSPSRR